VTLRVSWRVLGLLGVLVLTVAAGVLELGPPSSLARTERELVSAQRGVVQSTVTGTGNVEPATDVEANFQSSGILQHVYVSEGDHVMAGQLLATLDPTSAQLALDQAQENLASAEDQLANAEEVKVSTGSAGSATGASQLNPAPPAQFVSYDSATTSATTPATSTRTASSTTRPTITSPVKTPSVTSASPAGPSSSTKSASRATTSGSAGATTGSSGSTTGSSGAGVTTAASRAAGIASAQASVDGALASVQSAENALHETHLYAPAAGTVVSVASISPGSTVSGNSTSTSADSTASSGSATSGGAGASSGASGSGSLGGGASSATSASSSTSISSGFIEIVNTQSLTMTVAFSESDISKIRVGQPATVTLDALTGVELGAHVSAMSDLGSTSGGVVSYDATLTLDQGNSQVKPGMSASASVITGQASGLNLPNSAVSGSTGTVSHVNVIKGGRTVSTPVVIGLVGTDRTQIVSGLTAGEQVAVTETLPALGTSSATGSSSTLGGTSRFGGTSRLGGAGGFGGGGFGGAGGFGGGGFGGRG
jgi:multidrug efflux pump subunit AcrA (membrane-fusion protein)